MRVLVGCERSGVVRRAFREQGHEAWSCDLAPADDGGEHIVGDVRDVLADGWDVGIFHPPCTRLCNSGVRWLEERGLWDDLRGAVDLFYACFNAPIPQKALENPIPHGHAGLPPYTQILQPWMFGHGETKATCLWLHRLPPLMPTNVVEGREGRIHKLPPGPDRTRLRSETYEGIARAMAEQWGREHVFQEVLTLEVAER